MSEKIGILFLDHSSALGGAEQSLLLLLKYINRVYWHPHLANMGEVLIEKASALGVSTHFIAMPRLRGVSQGLLNWIEGTIAIARLARQIGVSLLYANTVRAAFYAALASRLVNVPFVWHMRDFWLSESRPRYTWADWMGKAFLCGLASRVITNSYATASYLPCQGKVTVIHNGIEVEHYDPSTNGAPFRRRYSIPDDVPVVGMVGRLRPWKGQDRFLRVLALVHQNVPDVWGVVVGGTPFNVDAEYPRRLRELAQALGVANKVVFTGHLEDIRPALAAMDVFVHPGDPEPFGLVNIEAMAMGKPVIAFAHGALPEIVVDGETGILIPPENEISMAMAVEELLLDPSRRYQMGSAGRKRVEEFFDIHQVVKQIEQELAKVAFKSVIDRERPI
ncbi:MAG: hypothetical protein DRI61_05320 [Chloroflexi bacterium]|nr:MAG: hypothetical protein DRI61_05320 [Chloroflexota bacterium]